jgi:hypothetical protein
MGQSLSPARTQQLSRSVRQEQMRCGDEAAVQRRGVELYSVHGLSRPCSAHDATTADQISCNMQQTTCSMYHATDIMQPATYNRLERERATCPATHMQHAAAHAECHLSCCVC